MIIIEFVEQKESQAGLWRFRLTVDDWYYWVKQRGDRAVSQYPYYNELRKLFRYYKK
jgi:hypothetical protein